MDKIKPPIESSKKVKRDKSSEAAAGLVYLQVLGNGGKGNPKSLFLFTDNKKYLFNCGEGVQRLANEFK